MDVIINKKIPLTAQICAFELVHADGESLPVFSAGSHIDVILENGLIRQYSLANCSSELHRYVIGVLNDEKSRGGSRYIHEHLKVGDRLNISEPRNLFPIHPQTKKAILFAGGIGITPVLAMAHELNAKHIPYDMHYFAKKNDALAFKDELAMLSDGNIYFHLDDEPESKANIEKILYEPNEEQHLYVCGPNGFMNFIIQSAEQQHWHHAQIHKEHFVAEAVDTSQDQEFDVVIKSTGQRIKIATDQSITQALDENGIFVPVSCEQGICGTCITNILEGIPEHRDSFLTDEERESAQIFTPCCSRSKTKTLVLDL